MRLFERLPDRIEIGGKRYRLKADFRNVLKMLYILENDHILPIARDWLALKCVMKRPPKDSREALAEIKKFLFGESRNSNEKRMTSFEQDADLIRAAFMQEYGINLYRDRLHWFEFTAFLHGLPNGTRYTEILGIRARPIPAPSKWNREDRDALIRAKAACALTMTEEEREKSYSRSLQRVFEDMKNITRGRGGNA